MKLHFSILFLMAYLGLSAQEIRDKERYNSVVVDLVKSDLFVCFPLTVQRSDGTIFRVLTSNFGLFGCYYNTNNYPLEFADTIGDILNFEFVGFNLEKCPKLADHAIDNSLYKKLGKQGIKKVLKKYFDTIITTENRIFFQIKKKYLSDKVNLTVLCFMCDNYYIISADNDGYYVAHHL